MSRKDSGFAAKSAGALLTMLAAAAAGTAYGQDAAESPAGELADRPDPCRDGSGDRSERLDRIRRGVSKSVCSSSRWFDGLFGDARNDAESYDESYGRIGVGLAWNELDDVSVDGHFRASVSLPVLGDRFNAVIGRETEDAFINDNFDDVGFLPGSFSDDRDADWYAGINYTTVDSANSHFDVGAGLQLQSPINPYVKARYRHLLHPAEAVLVTSRATAFWKNVDGFGVTLAVDTDWSVGDGDLLRWANTATRSEVTDGVRWKTGLAWYHALSGKSAMRVEGSIRGETAGVQPDLKELKLTFRRTMWRDWFFLETYGGAFWADSENQERRCNACGMAGVGFEMMFGRRYDSAAADAATEAR